MIASLRTYDEWRSCITDACGLRLTPGYVAERLGVLRDTAHPQTARFIETWGDAHRVRVIGWFEEAERRLGAP